jgi:hypothetical protein
MRFPKATLALLAVAVLALGAGVVAGTLGQRVLSPETNVVPGNGSTLSQELGLSADQRDRMQQIWEGVRTTAHDCQEQAQQLQKQRDDAVFALLTDEQKARYTQLTTECFGKIAALNTRREGAFGKAVEDTKAMLTDSQRKVYEQLIESRVGQHVSSGGENGPVQELAMRKTLADEDGSVSK